MLAAFDIPDSPTAIGGWLDTALMSSGLPTLVDELSVVNGAPSESLTAAQAREWLGDDAEMVLTHGLASLPVARLQQLLRRPSLLPAVQEFVLIDGGPHWEKLLNKLALTVRPKSTRNSRYLFLLGPIAVAASIGTAIVTDAIARRRITDGGHASGNTQMRGTEQTSPASQPATGEGPEAWGLSQRDIFEDAKTPAEIAARLAAGLEQWFVVADSAGDDIDLLRLRVGELWNGCEQFRTAKVDCLTPAAHADLVVAIDELQGALERQLEALSRGEPSAAANARREIDACVRGAVASLSQRD